MDQGLLKAVAKAGRFIQLQLTGFQPWHRLRCRIIHAGTQVLWGVDTSLDSQHAEQILPELNRAALNRLVRFEVRKH